MATLISPGVDVTIIDESFYVPGRAATIPLLFIATADEKTQPDETTPALGTYEYNVLRTVTSIKQSVELYGIPKFFTSASGEPHHGDARNEYGLDALNKYLEIGNRAYVIRANVNLNDNFDDVKALWTAKIAEAADYLNELITAWLAEYNATNNFVPADVGYRRSVTKSVLIELLNEALADVLTSYSFSKDEFETAFITDHTIAQAGYQDVLTETFNGYISLTDITGYEDDQTYGATIEVTSTSGTDTYEVVVNGEDVVTFGDLIDALDATFAGDATAELIQGRIRITSNLTGATSAVEILVDGQSIYLPLFASLNLFDRIATPVAGKGVDTLDIYNNAFTAITGSYEGLYGEIDAWTGILYANEFTADEAEGLLIAVAADFDNTKEFKNYTSLGANDAARRAEIVTQLQAVINNPSSPARAEYLEYTVALCPGYPETSDELLRLTQDMMEEVFIIGESPFNKPPTGPNSIATWAVSANAGHSNSYHIAYYYGHGISSNLDGEDIMTSAGSTALRVFAYNDSQSEVWFPPAGPNRGTCPHLTTVGYVSGTLGGPTTFVENFLDNGTRDELYEFPKNVNPITFIPGRGILVLGQKTTSPTISALDRVNVSRLVKFIKRQLRKALFSFLMEPNDKITRDNVKGAVDSFLATLIDRRGLYDFASICDSTNNTEETIDNHELFVDVAIKPVKSVEFIYVRVRVVRTGANIGTQRLPRV